MELMRTRQLHTKQNFYHTAKQTIKTHGFTSISSGMPATNLRNGLYTLDSFALAPILKENLQPYFEHSWISTALAGPTAGLLSGVVTHPFDTIKGTQHLWLDQKKLSASDIYHHIVKTHRGIEGLFIGSDPRILRIMSGTTISYNVNEKLSIFLETLQNMLTL